MCFVGFKENGPTNAYGELVTHVRATMRIAIPKCRQRIAPLFEVANRFVFFDTDSTGAGKIRSLPTWSAEGIPIAETCQKLSAEGVQVLLCGALSNAWERYLTDLGIEVHSLLLGNIDDILNTFQHEGLVGMHRLAMPGRGRYWHENRGRTCCDNLCIFKLIRSNEMSRFDFGRTMGRGMGGMSSGRQGVCLRDGTGSGFGRGPGNGQCRLDGTSGRRSFFSWFQNNWPISSIKANQSQISRLQSSIDDLQQQIAELKNKI